MIYQSVFWGLILGYTSAAVGFAERLFCWAIRLTWCCRKSASPVVTVTAELSDAPVPLCQTDERCFLFAQKIEKHLKTNIASIIQIKINWDYSNNIRLLLSKINQFTVVCLHLDDVIPWRHYLHNVAPIIKPTPKISKCHQRMPWTKKERKYKDV